MLSTALEMALLGRTTHRPRTHIPTPLAHLVDGSPLSAMQTTSILRGTTHSMEMISTPPSRSPRPSHLRPPTPTTIPTIPRNPMLFNIMRMRPLRRRQQQYRGTTTRLLMSQRRGTPIPIRPSQMATLLHLPQISPRHSPRLRTRPTTHITTRITSLTHTSTRTRTSNTTSSIHNIYRRRRLTLGIRTACRPSRRPLPSRFDHPSTESGTVPAEGSSTHHPSTHPSMLPMAPMARPKLRTYLAGQMQQQEPGLVSPPAPSSSRASTRSSGSIGLGLGLTSQQEFAGMDRPRVVLQLPLLRPPSTSSIPPHTPSVGGMLDSPNSSIITPSSNSITRMNSSSSLREHMEGIILRSSPAPHTATMGMRTDHINTNTTWQHQQALTAPVGGVPRLRRSQTSVRNLTRSPKMNSFLLFLNVDGEMLMI